jgi:hypothetical protein
MLHRLPTLLIELLVVLPDVPGVTLSLLEELLGAIHVDQDVAANRLDAEDLVVDRPKRREDEVDLP